MTQVYYYNYIPSKGDSVSNNVLHINADSQKDALITLIKNNMINLPELVTSMLIPTSREDQLHEAPGRSNGWGALERIGLISLELHYKVINDFGYSKDISENKVYSGIIMKDGIEIDYDKEIITIPSLQKYNIIVKFDDILNWINSEDDYDDLRPQHILSPIRLIN